MDKTFKASCENCKFCKRYYIVDENYRLIEIGEYNCHAPKYKGRCKSNPSKCEHYNYDNNEHFKCVNILSCLSKKYRMLNAYLERLIYEIDEIKKNNLK